MKFRTKLWRTVQLSLDDGAPMILRMYAVFGVFALCAFGLGVLLAARTLPRSPLEAVAVVSILPPLSMTWCIAWRSAVDLKMGAAWGDLWWVKHCWTYSFAIAAAALLIAGQFLTGGVFALMALWFWYDGRRRGGGGDGWDDPVLNPKPNPSAQA